MDIGLIIGLVILGIVGVVGFYIAYHMDLLGMGGGGSKPMNKNDRKRARRKTQAAKKERARKE